MGRPINADLYNRTLGNAAAVTHNHIIRAQNLSRMEWFRLRKIGALIPIIRGWSLFKETNFINPSSLWFEHGAYETFIADYLKSRYGDTFCLSAEASLHYHTQGELPRALHVMAQKGGAYVLTLLFNTTLTCYSEYKNYPDEITQIKNINFMTLALALARIGPSFYLRHPDIVKDGLRSLSKIDADALVVHLTKGNFYSAGQRIIGGLNNLGRVELAKYLQQRLENMNFHVRASDPFQIRC